MNHFNEYDVRFAVVQTSVPQNEAELQLYRVMQRASLLGYYDTLLEMGKYTNENVSMLKDILMCTFGSRELFQYLNTRIRLILYLSHKKILKYNCL